MPLSLPEFLVQLIKLPHREFLDLSGATTQILAVSVVPWLSPALYSDCHTPAKPEKIPCRTDSATARHLGVSFPGCR